ncbi:MAG TPA: cation:proton antiporter family protein, partial [Xanthomonadales bacterium]|nr:cation:proton antiporter family protein [Xanthomonadales bacterium]
CWFMGYNWVESTYISMALTFSSTIIIVKLLSDKGEADSLHGRVALGLLIVQDLVVVLTMIGLSAFGGKAGAESVSLLQSIGMMLVKGTMLLGGVALFMHFVVDRLLNKLAYSQELMVLFAISIAVALSAFCDWLGFSKELGAFLAGVMLASTQYRELISSRLKGLRDFMLLFFFIGLGSHIELVMLQKQIAPAVILSIFVLIGNPIIMMAIMMRMGYRIRTSFLAGVAIAQISEFSLILLTLAMQLGHVDEEIMSLVTLVGLITIALSTYLIMYSNELYDFLDPWLRRFERNEDREEPGSAHELKAIAGEFDVILFGLGRYGSNIARGLRQNGVRVLGVDFDPDMVRQWQRQGHAACYGDANDTHFPETLPLASARWVISALPPPRYSMEGNLQVTLLQALNAHHYHGKVAVTAHTPSAVNALKRAGADLVLLPFHDAAASAVNAVMSAVERKDSRQGQLL